MRQVQVVPKDNYRIYGAIVAKEVELAHKHKGTFHRSGPKEKDRAKWSHANYDGWLNLARSMGEVVAIEVRSKKPEKEWMLLRALLGFLDRHFAEKIQAINIQMNESHVKPKRRRRRR